MKRLLSLCLLALFATVAAEELPATNLQSYTHPELGIRVLGAEVKLPPGYWLVRPEGGTVVGAAYVRQDEPDEDQVVGERYGRYALERAVRQDAWPLHRVDDVIRRYAEGHDGVGPAKAEDLPDPGPEPASDVNWELRHQREQLVNARKLLLEGDRYRLLPSVSIPPPGKPVAPGVPLVIEVKPRVDDGKHYILYTNGHATRVDIDPDLLAKHGLTIEPMPAPKVVAADLVNPVASGLLVQLLPESAGPLRLRLELAGTLEHFTVTLDPAKAAAGDEEIFASWAECRIETFADYASAERTMTLMAWLDVAADLYDVNPVNTRRSGDRRDRIANTVGVLGGRAAIEETLQMHSLNDAGGDAARTVDIGTIEGVEVESHPFAEMLGGKPGGSMPLAEAVPLDRFFFHFAEPDAMRAFLDTGASFLHESGVLATGNSLTYDVEERYCRRLGLNRDWVRQLLKGDIAEEMALFTPDLFFIDGTDVTCLVRIKGLNALTPMLTLIGVTGLTDGAIVEKRVDDARAAYWAKQGDLLLVSTNRGEIERSLALIADPAPSLGRSAEFRYMLTKLPLRETTHAYAYFSDPFIRRLTGPEVKIGQLRRLKERIRLEAISAGALLYRADGHADVPGLPRLAELGYLPESFDLAGYSLDPQLVAHSRLYGRASDLATLLERPVRKVSEAEAKAYRDYHSAYTRFWRQFFDPIAVRFDRTGEGNYELGVFILPLIDSSIYDQVRQMIGTADGPALSVPVLDPPAVLTLSLNVGEQAWTEVAENMNELFEHIGLSPAILDEFGPSVHLAIRDADPVINLGSGDIFGAFGSGGFGRNEEMIMIPVMVSLLTRPCQLAIEVRNPDRVAAFIQQAVQGKPRQMDRWMSISLVQMAGREAWMLTFDLMGLVKLRYGLEVRDNYLMVSNLPWAQWGSLAGRDSEVLRSAAIAVNPGAGKLQLPGLFAAAAEQQRKAAFDGMSYLYPLLLANRSSVETACAEHYRLFGFAPAHPGEGAYRWDGAQLASTRFGTIAYPLQPEYDPGNRAFGLMQAVDGFSLSMQLEEGGLRSKLTWRLR